MFRFFFFVFFVIYIFFRKDKRATPEAPKHHPKTKPTLRHTNTHTHTRNHPTHHRGGKSSMNSNEKHKRRARTGAYQNSYNEKEEEIARTHTLTKLTTMRERDSMGESETSRKTTLCYSLNWWCVKEVKDVKAATTAKTRVSLCNFPVCTFSSVCT